MMRKYTDKELIIFWIPFIIFLNLFFFNYFGFNIPFIREMVGVVLLTFIPGLLLLKILKIDSHDPLQTLMFGIGLSLIAIMGIGTFINFFYPIIGIEKPISEIYVIITYLTFIFILFILSHIISPNFQLLNNLSSNSLSKSIIIGVILVCLIFIHSYVNKITNIVSIVLVLIIAISIIIFTWSKVEIKYNIPFFIYLFSLILLLGRSLSLPFLSGTDINIEFYYAKLIVNNGFWNSSLPHNYNSMLSATILPVVYMLFTGIDLINVYKYIYQFIYAFIPVCLYIVCKIQTNEKISLLSSFLFIALIPFHVLMFNTPRQEIAEFFFILIILLIVNDSLNFSKKYILLTIFLIGIVVSHYGLSYLLAGIVILALLCNSVIKNFNFNIFSSKSKMALVNLNSCILLIIFLFVWNFITTSGSVFSSILSIFNKIQIGIQSDLFTPENNEAANYLLLMKESNIFTTIDFILQIIFQMFIFLGILLICLGFFKTKMKKEYLLLSIGSVIILLICLTVPMLGSQLNVPRTYHITLLLLAPFCVIGGCWLLENINKKFIKNITFKPLRILSILFIMLFFLEIGLFHDISNNPRYTSIIISSNNILDIVQEDDEIRYYCYYFHPENDISGAAFLSNNKKQESTIYSDITSYLSLIGYGNIPPKIPYYFTKFSNKHSMNENDLYFISYANNVEHFAAYRKIQHLGANDEFEIINIDKFNLNYLQYNIYSNGKTKIFGGSYISRMPLR